MTIISELGTIKTCPECIREDYSELWNFTAVMTNDYWCGGNTVTTTARVGARDCFDDMEMSLKEAVCFHCLSNDVAVLVVQVVFIVIETVRQSAVCSENQHTYKDLLYPSPPRLTLEGSAI